jgi:hypothetical protein
MFRIELVTQNPEKVYEAKDPLSMGRMRVVIDGVEVWNGDSNLSSSARSLLRTIDTDFAGPLNGKVFDHHLVLHSCGFLPFGSCPIGVSWRVLHAGDQIHVDRVMRALTIGGDEVVLGISEPVIVAHADYAREVRAFAGAVQPSRLCATV